MVRSCLSIVRFGGIFAVVEQLTEVFALRGQSLFEKRFFVYVKLVKPCLIEIVFELTGWKFKLGIDTLSGILSGKRFKHSTVDVSFHFHHGNETQISPQNVIIAELKNLLIGTNDGIHHDELRKTVEAFNQWGNDRNRRGDR